MDVLISRSPGMGESESQVINEHFGVPFGYESFCNAASTASAT